MGSPALENLAYEESLDIPEWPSLDKPEGERTEETFEKSSNRKKRLLQKQWEPTIVSPGDSNGLKLQQGNLGYMLGRTL